MESLYEPIGLRVIWCSPYPLGADQLRQGSEKGGLELRPLVGRYRERCAKIGNPIVKENFSNHSSLHITHRDCNWPSGKTVYGRQAVLQSVDERQLYNVHMHMIEAFVGFFKTAELCAVVTMHLGFLAWFAISAPAGGVLPNPRPAELLRERTGGGSTAGVRKVMHDVEGLAT